MPSVKIVEKWDMMGIFKFVNEIRQKMNSSSSPFRGKIMQWLGNVMQWLFFFREREDSFSLGFRPIGPSVFDGARRKVVLRGEGYAWTPIWWSSDNSKRYGSFPTCVNPCLRTM